MEFIAGYREANAPQRPVEESSSRVPPVIKVNGHRTATIDDLEHAEAVREAHHGNVASAVCRRRRSRGTRDSNSPTSRATPPPATTVVH